MRKVIIFKIMPVFKRFFVSLGDYRSLAGGILKMPERNGNASVKTKVAVVDIKTITEQI